ncbi:MAG: Cna B-type domain-containing protein [Tissierellia bacterium]|nr:Cna B-type domain-containing protein [Tissierellia bacterium]
MKTNKLKRIVAIFLATTILFSDINFHLFNFSYENDYSVKFNETLAVNDILELKDQDFIIENGTIIGIKPDRKEAIKQNPNISIIPESARVIASEAFKDINLNSIIIGGSVEIISAHTFQNKGLKKVVVKDNVKHIEQYAFADNEIAEFKDLAQLDVIGEFSFYSNNLKSLVTSSLRIFESAFAANNLKDVIFEKVIEVKSSALKDNPELKTVEVNTQNPTDDLFVEDTFGEMDSPVEVIIKNNANELKSKNSDKYLINSIFITIQLKDKSNNGLLTDEIIERKQLLEIPDTYSAPEVQGYTIVGSQEVAIDKSGIENNKLTVEIFYERNREPQILVDQNKKLIFGKNIRVDLKEILKDINFYDSQGNSVEVFINGILNPKIKVSSNTLSPNNQVKIIPVEITFEESENKKASTTVEFSFVEIDISDNEIIEGAHWLYKDFKYRNGNLIGFSESGLERLKTNSNVILPGTNPVTGEPIKAIDSNSFKDVKIETIDFIDMTSLERINARAFENSGLSTILNISSSKYLKTIGYESFKNNKLTDFDFSPLTLLEEIQQGAFYKNNLERVYLSGHPKLREIGNSVFDENKIEELVISETPELRRISDYAFRNNKIKSLDLQNLENLEHIGYMSFTNNEIKELNLKNLPKLEVIRIDAFRNNKMQNLTFSELPLLKLIEENSFSNNLLETVDFSELSSLEKLGGFENNKLQSINIEGLKKLKTILNYAFKNNNLSEVNLVGLDSLESIKYQSFSYNPNLKKVTFKELPNFTNMLDEIFFGTSIDDVEFIDLPKLKNIKGFKSIKTLSRVVMENLPVLEEISGFNNTDIKNLTIKDLPELKRFGSLAFYEAKIGNMLMENLPKLEEYRAHSFANNRQSGSLELSKFPTVTTIAENAFSGNSYTSVDFTGLNSLRIIGNSAFSGDHLEKVEIKNLENLERINQGAFWHQKSGQSLLSVELENLNNLKYLAGFEHNYKLEKLVLKNLPKLEEIGVSAFFNTKISEADLTELSSLKKIGDYAFKGEGYKEKNSIVELKLPVSLESIGVQSFRNNLISEIDLSHLVNLKEIKNEAFIDNPLSTKFILPSTEDYINIGKTIANVKAEDLDFSKTPNVKLKFLSAKPFISDSPLIMTFEKASQIDFAQNLTDVDLDNPTIIYIKNMDKDIVAPPGVLINPQKITIRHKSTLGEELAGEEVKYIAENAEIASKKIGGYDATSIEVQPNEGISFEDLTNIATVEYLTNPKDRILTFVYEQVNPIEAPEYDIKINRAVFKDERFYHQGRKLNLEAVYNLKKIPGDEENTKVVIQLPKHATKNPKKVQFPPDIQGIELSGKPYYDADTKQVIYPIKKINSESVLMKIRVIFEYDGLNTPNENVDVAKAYYVLSDSKIKGNIAKSEKFIAIHYKPGFTKNNAYGENETIFTLAKPDTNNKYADVSMQYSFRFDNLQRRAEKLVITDVLPKYFKWNPDKNQAEEAYAKFDPQKNKGWEYDDINHTVKYTVNKDVLDTLLTDYGERYEHWVHIENTLPRLVLDFPDAVSQKNIKNSANMEIHIDNPQNGEEPIISLRAVKNRGIEISTNSRGVYINKSGSEFLAPYSTDTNRIYKWDVKIVPEKVYVKDGNTGKYYEPTIKNIELWDFDLERGRREQDKLLYYYSIKPSHDVEISLYSHLLYYDHKTRPNLGGLISKHRVKAGETYIFTDEEIKNTKSIKLDYGDLVLRSISESASFELGTKLRDGKTVPNANIDLNNFARYYADMDVQELGLENRLIQSYTGASKYVRIARKFIETNKVADVSRTKAITDINQEINYTVGFNAGYTLSNIKENFFIKDFKQVDILSKLLVLKDIKLDPEFEAYGGTFRFESLPDGNTKLIFSAPNVPSNLGTVARIKTELKVGIPGDSIIKNKSYIDFTETGIAPDEKIEIKNGQSTPEESGKKLSTANYDLSVLLNDSLSGKKFIRKSSVDGHWGTEIDTIPGEKFEYKFEVSNNFPINIEKIEIFDLFPDLLDRNLVRNLIGNHSLRGSEFRNQFLGVKSIQIINNKTDEVKVTDPQNYPIIFLKNKSDFPKTILDGTTKEWVDKAINNPEYITDNVNETVGIYLGGKKESAIPPGHRLEVIVEMKAPNYSMDNVRDWEGKVARNSIAINYGESERYTEATKVVNRLISPKRDLVFKKIDTDTKEVLQGARYRLSQGDIVRESVSGPDGNIYFKNVYYKPYTIQEIVAPKGYKIDTQKFVKNLTLSDYEKDIQAIDNGLNPNAEIIQVFEDKKLDPPDNKRYTIKINKKSGHDNIQNVKFSLENIFTNEVKEGLTDRNGVVVFENLTKSQYKLTEVSNRNRFTLIEPVILELPLEAGFNNPSISKFESSVDTGNPDHTIYQFEIQNEKYNLELIKLGVKDLVRQKQDYERRLSEGIRLRDVNFKLYKTGRRIQNLSIVNDGSQDVLESLETTNSSGSIVFKSLIPNIVYKLVEENAPQDYEERGFVEFYLDDNGEVKSIDHKPYLRKDILLVTNIRSTKTSRIEITKIDADTNQKLEGATFKLSKFKNGQYIELEDEGVQDKKYTQTTGESGIISFEDLEYGRYRVDEIKAPDGYIKGREPLEFNVDPYVGKLFKKTVKNKKIDFRIEKVEEISGPYDSTEAANRELENLKVQREDAEDLFVAESRIYKRLKGAKIKLSQRYTNDAGLIATKEIKPISTEENGYSVYKYGEGMSQYGSFIVEELTAPTGYKKLRSQNIKLDRILNYEKPSAVFYLKNKPIKGQINITKFEGRENKVLKDAEFSIYEGRLTEEQLLNATPIARKTTDKDGIIRFIDLDLGDYTVVETKAPTNYKVLDNNLKHVILTPDRSIVQLSFYNNFATTTLLLRKVDDNGKPIENLDESNFELYYDGIFHSTGVASNQTGVIKFENVPIIGRYKVKEKKAPRGYVILGSGEHDFEITPQKPLSTDATQNEIIEFVNKEQIDIKGSKQWIGGKEAERPDVFLKLFRNYNGGNEEALDVEIKKIGKVDGEINFGKFDKYKHLENGTVLEYKYYVKEVDEQSKDLDLSRYHYISKYTGVNEGERSLNIENTYESPKTGLTVTKMWENGKNVVKPDFKFELYRKTENTEYEPVVGKEATVPKPGIMNIAIGQDLKTHFNDLPINDKNANPYTYMVKEVRQDGSEIDKADLFIPAENEIVAEKIEGTEELRVKFVNQFTIPKKEVEATKIWIDGPQERPDVWFKLYRNVENGEVEEVPVNVLKVDKTSNKAVWSNVDSTDIEGRAYTFTVKEVNEMGENVSPKNYEKSEEGLKVTNTYVSPKIQKKVRKTWEFVDGEQIPSEIELILKRRAEGVEEVVANRKLDNSFAVENNEKVWEYVFENLDQTNKNGVEYDYTIEEKESKLLEGYDKEVLVTQEGFEIVNRQKKTSKPVSKVWENQTRDENPEKVVIDLYRSDKKDMPYKSIELKEDNQWRYEFTNLPTHDSLGNEYEYSVEEREVKGYVKSIDQERGIVTNTKETISLEVTKIWEDESNNLDRPEEIRIKLYRNKEEDSNPYEIAILRKTDSENEWKHTFNNLPKYDISGRQYKYTVEEEKISGYKTVIEEYSVTNIRELVNIPVVKVWEQKEKIYPKQITYRLYREGEEIAQKTLSREEAEKNGEWNYTFEVDKQGRKLPKTNPISGKEYRYRISEDKVEGYTTEIEGFNVKNIQNTRVVQIEKVWENGPKPETILQLRRKVEVEGQDRVDDAFKIEFRADKDNLVSENYRVPTHDGEEREYSYYVEEPTVPENYEASVKGFVVTNRYVQPKKEVEATKIWIDGPQERPDVWFKLYRNVENGEVEEVPVNVLKVDKTSNKAVWSNVDSTDIEGRAYTFTVKEVNEMGENVSPKNYEKSEEGLKVTNTYVSPKIQKKVRKTWEFVDGEQIPSEIELILKRRAEGVEEVVANRKLDNSFAVENNEKVWEYVFENLDQTNKNGVEYDYTIEEKESKLLEGYDKEVLVTQEGFEIVNRQKKTSKPVSKVWENQTRDENPEKVVIDLYRSDKKDMPYKSIELKEDNQWRYEFTNLPTHDSLGNEYEYSVEEREVKGYVKSIDQERGIVTNTKETISLEVTKIWEDESNNLDRPEEIRIKLYRNKEEDSNPYEIAILRKTDSENEWKHTFNNLPKYDISGRQYKYTVEEEKISGYKTVIEEYSVTNIRELVNIPVVKVWEQKEKIYPKQITYRLYREGEEIAQKTLSREEAEKNGEWNYTFEVDKQGRKLPKTNPISGKEYRYRISEDKVEGYTTEIEGFNVKNIQNTRVVQIEKVWENGPKPETILQLRRKVEVEGQDRVDDAFKIEFRADKDNLVSENYRVPTHDGEEREYSYYVEEPTVPENYEASVKGFVVTNRYVQPKKEVEATKIWVNAPKEKPEIWLQLYRKTDKVDEKIGKPEVLNSNEEKSTIKWKDLEEFDLDGNIYEYYVKEVDSQGNPFVPENYVNEEKGLEITNTYQSIKTSIEVLKKWENIDINNVPEVTVKLVKNGIGTDKIIKLNKLNGWKSSFDNLDKYEVIEGIEREIVYTIEEISENTEKIGEIKLGDDKFNYRIEKVENGYVIINKKIDEPKTDKAPETGDNFNHMLRINGFILAIAVFLILEKKKRVKNTI